MALGNVGRALLPVPGIVNHEPFEFKLATKRRKKRDSFEGSGTGRSARPTNSKANNINASYDLIFFIPIVVRVFVFIVVAFFPLIIAASVLIVIDFGPVIIGANFVALLFIIIAADVQVGN